MIFLTREMTFLAFFFFADSGNTSLLTQYAHHDFTYYENYQPTSNAGILFSIYVIYYPIIYSFQVLVQFPIRTFISMGLKKYANQISLDGCSR